LYLTIVICSTGKFVDNSTIKDLGIHLLLISTLIPGKALSINGPWWFYSMIFQLYLLFPIFMWIERKYSIKGLISLALLGLVGTVLLYNPMGKIGLNPIYLSIYLSIYWLFT
jgi:peptidoglycan/LPS O-acetylase OafA/YrhL